MSDVKVNFEMAVFGTIWFSMKVNKNPASNAKVISFSFLNKD